MEFVINAKELRKAMRRLEKAEKNGFKYCQSIFEFVRAGSTLDDNVAEYIGILEKAHPTDASFDWGRGQDVTKKFRFVKGKLIPR